MAWRDLVLVRSRFWLAARDYARRAGVTWESTRFDIVSVMMQPRLQIEWIRDAFPLCGESASGAWPKV